VRPRFLPLIGLLLSPLALFVRKRTIKTSAGKLTQTQVDAIVEKCGGLPGMVTINNDQLLIHRSKDFSINGRVLMALQATGETTLSAVGNERHDPNMRHPSES